MKHGIVDLPLEILSANGFFNVAKFLPLQLVGLPLPLKEIENVKFDHDVSIFSRLNLDENKMEANKIKHQISSKRNVYEIISIEPTSPSLISFAARDRRVDVIRISTHSQLKEFNTRFGRRIEEYGKLIELDISFFWSNNVAKNGRQILRILKSWNNCQFPIILTRSIGQLQDIRSYPGLQSIGRMIGLDNSKTKLTPLIKKIEENGKKISGVMPLEGVEISEW